MKTPLKPQLHRIGRSPAFTLMELLAVIAILAVLVALLFPVLGSMRNASNKATTVSSTKQMLGLWQMYSAENNGYLMAVNAGGTDGYWMELMNRLSPGATEHRASVPLDQRYRLSRAKVKGPLDGSIPFVSLNVFMGPNLQNQNQSDYSIVRIQHPAKTVVFGDSRWDVFVHGSGYYGGSSISFRYDKEKNSIFGFADGHVETVETRDTSSSTPTPKVPSGFYYNLTQENPWP